LFVIPEGNLLLLLPLSLLLPLLLLPHFPLFPHNLLLSPNHRSTCDPDLPFVKPPPNIYKV